MGILNYFERRLEGAVEGIFSKVFRTGLHPVELATQILKEMETHKTVGVRNVWVPNHYLFRLSEADAARFRDTQKALRSELEHVVEDGARERGWGLVGPPEVEFEADPDLLRPVDVPVLRGDHGRISAATGWKPEIPLEQTLADLLAYWRGQVRTPV